MWGENGFGYVMTNMTDIYFTYQVNGPVTSLSLDNTDIECNDNDGDGYYTWGLGPKPPYCPASPDLPDGDDSNPCFGPMDQYGNLQSFSSPKPTAEDVTVFEGQAVTPSDSFGKQPAMVQRF